MKDAPSEKNLIGVRHSEAKFSWGRLLESKISVLTTVLRSVVFARVLGIEAASGVIPSTLALPVCAARQAEPLVRVIGVVAIAVNGRTKSIFSDVIRTETLNLRSTRCLSDKGAALDLRVCPGLPLNPVPPRRRLGERTR